MGEFDARPWTSLSACLLNWSSNDAGCGEAEISLLYWPPEAEDRLFGRHISFRFSSEYLHPAILSFFFAHTPQTALEVSICIKVNSTIYHVIMVGHEALTWANPVALHLARSASITSNSNFLALPALGSLGRFRRA